MAFWQWWHSVTAASATRIPVRVVSVEPNGGMRSFAQKLTPLLRDAFRDDEGITEDDAASLYRAEYSRPQELGEFAALADSQRFRYILFSYAFQVIPRDHWPVWFAWIEEVATRLQPGGLLIMISPPANSNKEGTLEKAAFVLNCAQHLRQSGMHVYRDTLSWEDSTGEVSRDDPRAKLQGWIGEHRRRMNSECEAHWNAGARPRGPYRIFTGRNPYYGNRAIVHYFAW
jgi:hypothetical protein